MTRSLILLSLCTLCLATGCDDDDPADPTPDVGPVADADPMPDTDPMPDMDPMPDADPMPDMGPEGSPLSMTILHINDHHSHLGSETLTYDVSALDLIATADEAGAPLAEIELAYGGFPLLATLFDTLTAATDNVVRIHAGDAITGTLYYSLFAGRADAALMNRICFDAFGLGNHEFDDGDARLAAFLDALAEGDCDTPVIAANVEPGPDSPLRDGYLQPYTVLDVAGQRVGLIGIDIAQKTMASSSPDPGTVLTDETTTAQRYIDELTADGIDKIVLVTHYTYANDLVLAGALRGVDVIVGGDSHSLLGGDDLTAIGWNVEGPYPTEVQNADGDPVCVVQAWQYAYLLGELRVDFDAAGVVTACAGSPRVPFDPVSLTYTYIDGEGTESERPLDGADAEAVIAALSASPAFVPVAPDADTAALLAAFDAEVGELVETVIGTVDEILCLDRWPGEGRSTLCPREETYARGSDVANHVAKAFLTVTPTADIAIQNAGGVRVDVAAGPYTIADAYSLLPFSNTLWTLEMTGEEIVAMLEDALSNTLDDGGSSGSYPYASGLRFHVDASAAFGDRVSNVEINPRLAGDWAPIDLAAMYTVVTHNFIGAGRDGYDTFGEISARGMYLDTFTEYAQSWIDYVETYTAAGETLSKLPVEEYSTQRYIGRDGCDHAMSADCEGY